MSSIIEISDLAVDRRGKTFAPHPEADQWQPERVTASQTILCTRFGRRVYLPLGASYEDLEEEVGHVTGLYRLRQVRADLTVIEDAPCGYIEVQGVNLGATAHRVGIEDAIGLATQAIHANEKKDELMADVVKSMLATQVQLQMGTVKVLDAVGSIIPVASGIQAIERPPPVIDLDEMATLLLEAMEEQREEEDASNDNRDQGVRGWFSALVNHPIAKQFGQQFMEQFMGLRNGTNPAKGPKNSND